MSFNRNALLPLASAWAVLLAPEELLAQAVDVLSRADANRVCATTTVWRLGVGPGRTPFDMVETVAPLDVEGRAVWRVMHTMLRSVEDSRLGKVPSFDVLDVDRATLAPLQGEHRTTGSPDTAAVVTRFDFRTAPGTVLRLNSDGSTAERITLTPGQRVLPEGPGANVLEQAIAWSDGLKMRGYIIDRWRGRENQRLREIEIAVTGRSSREIGGRRIETFVVTEQPVDGGYHWLRHVTVARPHRHVYSQYYANGLREGARPFTSEAVALMQDASCAKG